MENFAKVRGGIPKLHFPFPSLSNLHKPPQSNAKKPLESIVCIYNWGFGCGVVMGLVYLKGGGSRKQRLIRGWGGWIHRDGRDGWFVVVEEI